MLKYNVVAKQRPRHSGRRQGRAIKSGTRTLRQTSAEAECIGPCLCRGRRSLQRLVGDFVAKDIFFGLVESDGGVGHGITPFPARLLINFRSKSCAAYRCVDTCQTFHWVSTSRCAPDPAAASQRSQLLVTLVGRKPMRLPRLFCAVVARIRIAKTSTPVPHTLLDRAVLAIPISLGPDHAPRRLVGLRRPVAEHNGDDNSGRGPKNPRHCGPFFRTCDHNVAIGVLTQIN